MSDTSTPSHLDANALITVESLELRARLIVEGFMIGMHRSPYHGVSVEFAQHRQYAAGDDLRHLDWKVFGRTDKLYLKQYQKETNLRLIILVDVSGSMGYGSQTVLNWRKYDMAAVLAAAMAYLAIHQQDRVRLALFDSKLVAETGLSNAHDHWRSIISLLESAPSFDPPQEPAEPRSTDLARLFDQVTARLTHRSLVVLISDLFDDADAIERGIARLNHRRHDMIVLQTLDHAELHFPFRSPSQFVGMEDEGRLNLDPMALRQVYLQSIESHLTRVEQITRRFHFDYLRLDTSKTIGAPLSHFLAHRAALIGKSKQR